MKKLFEKKINLKESRIFGGVSTTKADSSKTTTGNCSDVTHVTKDDNGKTIEVCTDFDCP